MVKLVMNKKTGDYTVIYGKKKMGLLYEWECPWLGRCWVFDVHVKGVFGRDAYFYSTPERAVSWIPKELRNEIDELSLYRASASVVH
ncbi:MAG: hypothetical protein PHN75_10255 [Syntrophales bacterium]|nr:hypothetical protein [Syntrophales bacterium]